MFRDIFDRLLRRRSSDPIIQFSCAENLIDVLPHPVPANRAMPDWFRAIAPNMERTDVDQKPIIKKCVPAMDARSQAFIIPLWCDLHIRVNPVYDLFDENDELIDQIETRYDFEPVGEMHNDKKIARIDKVSAVVWVRPSMNISAENDIGEHTWNQVGELCDLKKFKFGRVLLKLINPWTIQTPPGYSCKFSNPANNWSTDIELLEGVVDTDEYYTMVNFPFVYTNDQEGEFVVPRGTPIVHVVPFKRQKYKMSVEATDMRKRSRVELLLSSMLTDRYRNLFWHKRKQ